MSDEALYDERLATLYDYSPAFTRRPDHPAVGFYVDACLRSGGPVLHVGIATGIYALPLARAGLEVIGVDLSAAMLRVVARKLESEPVAVRARISLAEQDMRSMRLERRCKTAVLPGNIFQLNLTVGDQLRALRSVWEHLEEGGNLILEAFTPDLTLIAGGLTKRSPRQFEFEIPQLEQRFTCQRTITVDAQRQLLHHRLIQERVDPGGHLSDRQLTNLTYRYNFPWELLYLIRLAGFRIQQRFGDFEGTRSVRYDGYQIVIAEKVGQALPEGLLAELTALEQLGPQASTSAPRAGT
jgi:SAM-dependent methyltransferase